MPVTEAVALAQAQSASPHLQPHDAELDHQHLLAVADAVAKQITPAVSLEKLDDQRWANQRRHQPESLLCEITGAAHLFGGETALGKAAEELLQFLGLRVLTAIADTVGAAWALAHYAGPPRSAGPWVAPAGAVRSSLQPLPVEALRIAPATLGTLRRLGVERIDELLRLPRSGLASRLGDRLVQRIDQALGNREEPLAVHRPAADDSESWQLEYPTDDHRILRDRLDRLADRVASRLAGRDRGALGLECRWELSDHAPVMISVGLFAPTTDARHWSELIAGAMETKRWSSQVTRITLSVTLSGPLRSTQTSLFGEAPSGWQRGAAIARFVDALSGRLGRDAVQGVRLEADPLPENAYRCFPWTARPVDPFTGGRRSHKRSRRHRSADPPESHRGPFNRWETSHRDAMRRPLVLFPQPRPLVVVKPSDGDVPEAFRQAGVFYRVVRHWGPERIETQWWSGRSIRRDYYRVEIHNGDWWWIFRDLTSGADHSHQPCAAWMLHGQFS